MYQNLFNLFPVHFHIFHINLAVARLCVSSFTKMYIKHFADCSQFQFVKCFMTCITQKRLKGYMQCNAILLSLQRIFFTELNVKNRIKIGAEITELSISQYGYFYLLLKSNKAKIETTENEAVTSPRQQAGQQVWWLV